MTDILALIILLASGLIALVMVKWAKMEPALWLFLTIIISLCTFLVLTGLVFHGGLQ